MRRGRRQIRVPTRPVVRLVIAGHASQRWAGRDTSAATTSWGMGMTWGGRASFPAFSVLLLCRVLRLVVVMSDGLTAAVGGASRTRVVDWLPLACVGGKGQAGCKEEAFALLGCCLSLALQQQRDPAATSKHRRYSAGAKASRLHTTHPAHRPPTPCAFYVQKDTRHKRRVARTYFT